MSSSRKSKRRTNPIARALRTPTFRQRKVRPKKGRGSYSRVKRSETLFVASISTVDCPSSSHSFRIRLTELQGRITLLGPSKSRIDSSTASVAQ